MPNDIKILYKLLSSIGEAS